MAKRRNFSAAFKASPAFGAPLFAEGMKPPIGSPLGVRKI